MVHRYWKILPLIALLFILAGCAPPSRLPEGPTPIPTLIPVTEEAAAAEPTEPSFAILSYPVRPPSALEGEKIFQDNCAECHGVDGTGVVPGARNFQDLDYMRGETPAYFYSTVTEGRGDMPAYNSLLSSDERWDVVFYVWRHSTTSEILAQGGQIFEANCAACHGVDGSGELLGSADFTDPRQMSTLAPRDLYLTVTQGRGSMPAWQSQLTQDQRWSAIDYVRAFTYDPTISGEINLAQEPGEVPSACPADQTNAFAWDDGQAIQSGEALFGVQCGICHGADAGGGLPNTPDFTSSEVNRELLANEGSFFCIVQMGEGVMPSFGDTLTSDEIWQILTFLGSLGSP
jgi:mono/diheme cytochrome c family protein